MSLMKNVGERFYMHINCILRYFNDIKLYILVLSFTLILTREDIHANDSMTRSTLGNLPFFRYETIIDPAKILLYQTNGSSI